MSALGYKRTFCGANVSCPKKLVSRLAIESQGSPLLMQQMCWEVCAGIGVDKRSEKNIPIKEDYDLVPICFRLSKDSPIYTKLVLGPQNRKVRQKRKLKAGGSADIYRVILLAMASTGPTSVITYDDLKSKINDFLSDGIPQKNEITGALKHLSHISQTMGNDAGIDWDTDERKVDISDPYLRFHLRWQIKPIAELPPIRDPFPAIKQFSEYTGRRAARKRNKRI